MTHLKFGNPGAFIDVLKKAVRMAGVDTTQRQVLITGSPGGGVLVVANGSAWYAARVDDVEASESEFAHAVAVGKLLSDIVGATPSEMELELGEATQGELRFGKSKFKFLIPGSLSYDPGVADGPDEEPEVWFGDGVVDTLKRIAAVSEEDFQPITVFDGHAATWLHGTFVAAGEVAIFRGEPVAISGLTLKLIERDAEIGFTERHIWARGDGYMFASPLCGSAGTVKMFELVTSKLLKSEIEPLARLDGKEALQALNPVRAFAKTKESANIIVKMSFSGDTLTASSPATEIGLGTASVPLIGVAREQIDLYIAINQLAIAIGSLPDDEVHLSLLEKDYIIAHGHDRSLAYLMGRFPKKAFKQMQEALDAIGEE